MGASRRPQGSRRRWRSRLAAVALSLLPALVLVGLFAPGVVRVSEGEEEAAQRGTHASSHRGRALLVPREFSTGFLPDVLDLDRLFARSRFRLDPRRARLSRMLGFRRHGGDTIVLDDLDQYVKKSLFRDALVDDFVAKTALGRPDGLHPVADPLPLGDGLRFDDFPGGADSSALTDPPVVPEPSTGLLLGAGLAWLAGRRRLRS